MAKVTSNLGLLSGRMGNVVFRTVGGQMVSSVKVDGPRNPRSGIQQSNRAKWLNNMSFASVMKMQECPFGFEEKHGTQSNHSLIQKYGAKSEPAVYILQEMKTYRNVVLTEFPISRGSLPEVAQSYDDELGVLLTDIPVNEEGNILSNDTIMVLHIHPYKVSSNFYEFKAEKQALDKHPELRNREVYCLECKSLELTKSPKNALACIDESFGLCQVDGRLALKMAPEDGACIYLKRTKKRGTSTAKETYFFSSQNLVLGSAALAYREQWITPEAAEVSIASIR